MKLLPSWYPGNPDNWKRITIPNLIILNIYIQFNQIKFWNTKKILSFYLLVTGILKRIGNLKMKIRRIKIALLFHYFRLIGTNTKRIDLDEMWTPWNWHSIYIHRSISIYPYEKKMIDWFLHIHSFFFLVKHSIFILPTVIDNIVETNWFYFFLLYGFNRILLVVTFFHFILKNKIH